MCTYKIFNKYFKKLKGQNFDCVGRRLSEFIWIWLPLQLMTCSGAYNGPMMARLPGLSETNEDKYISRLNYGLVALKNKRVCVTEGYVTHTFHIVLPPREPIVVSEPKLNNTECDDICSKIKGLNEGLEELTINVRQVITNLIDKIYQFIPDINKPFVKRTRQPRALVGVVGDFLSFLFGSATNTDVERLRKEILASKDLVGMAAAEAIRRARP
jgi:hypothetical protein